MEEISVSTLLGVVYLAVTAPLGQEARDLANEMLRNAARSEAVNRAEARILRTLASENSPRLKLVQGGAA